MSESDINKAKIAIRRYLIKDIFSAELLKQSRRVTSVRNKNESLNTRISNYFYYDNCSYPCRSMYHITKDSVGSHKPLMLHEDLVEEFQQILTDWEPLKKQIDYFAAYINELLTDSESINKVISVVPDFLTTHLEKARSSTHVRTPIPLSDSLCEYFFDPNPSKFSQEYKIKIEEKHHKAISIIQQKLVLSLLLRE